MKFKVKALINFNDLEEDKNRKIGDEFECSKTRCDFLLEHKAIEVIEEIKEKKEIAKKELEETFDELSKVIDKEIKVEEVEEKPKKKKNGKK